MRVRIRKSSVLAAGLGMIAGMRSLSAPALVVNTMGKKSEIDEEKPYVLKFLKSPQFAAFLKFLKAGEQVGDKMPGIPDRINVPSLTGRFISGALSGASVFSFLKEKAWKGALIGGISAIVSTYTSFYARKKSGEFTGIPDVVLGMLEDRLVRGMTTRLTREIILVSGIQVV